MSSALVAPWWTNPAQVLPTTATAISTVPARAIELDLAGNIHDALIAQVCREHDVGLVTLEVCRHRLALALGVDSTYLLAP